MRIPRLLGVQFSLLTLLLFVAWFGSGLALFVRGRSPWISLRRFETAIPFTYQPKYQITQAVLSHDALRLFAAAEDSRLRMFDARSGALLWNVAFDPTWKPSSDFHEARFIEDDRFVEVLGMDRNQGLLFDSATGLFVAEPERAKILGRNPVPRKQQIVSQWGIAFSPDGTRKIRRNILSTGPLSGRPESGGWDLSDPATDTVIATIKSPDGWPMGAAFSPDNKRFATASYDRTVNICDNSDGHLLALLVPEPKMWCLKVNFSDDGSELVVARPHDVLIYQRQFPESKLGILYRSEIWACACCFMLWLARLAVGLKFAVRA